VKIFLKRLTRLIKKIYIVPSLHRETLTEILIGWGHRWKYASAFSEDKALVCAD